MITIHDFQKFHYDFYNTDKYPHLRIGQAFCNIYEIQDAILFYETNATRAIARILEKYVKI